MKTSELTGSALDWAVEYALTGNPVDPDTFVMRTADESHYEFWAQGGPIIERETICIEGRPGSQAGDWAAHYSKRLESQYFYSIGPTPLIAAMRCVVASKLGDEVEIPEELQ